MAAGNAGIGSWAGRRRGVPRRKAFPDPFPASVPAPNPNPGPPCFQPTGHTRKAISQSSAQAHTTPQPPFSLRLIPAAPLLFHPPQPSLRRAPAGTVPHPRALGAHLVVLGVQPEQVVDEALIDSERVLGVEARGLQDARRLRPVALLARVDLRVGQVPQVHRREGA